MPRPTQPTLPPVTDAHRRQAFAILSMPAWTYTAAMADPLRGQVIEAMAASIRTAHWRAAHTQTQRLVRRLNPKTGTWCTQRVPGPYDHHQAAIDLRDRTSPVNTDYAINVMRCALRMCASALDELTRPSGAMDPVELAEINDFVQDVRTETDGVARIAKEGNTP